MANLLKKINKLTGQSAAAAQENRTSSNVEQVLELQEEVKQGIEQPISTERTVTRDEKCELRNVVISQNIGNKVNVVEGNTYTSVSTPREIRPIFVDADEVAPIKYDPQIADHIRFASNKYWFKLEDGEVLQYGKENNSRVSDNQLFTMRIESLITEESDDLLPHQTDFLYLVPNERKFTKNDRFDSIAWAAVLNGGGVSNFNYDPMVQIGDKFDDFTYNFYTPLNEQNNISSLTKEAKVGVNYNFSIPRYEAAIKNVLWEEEYLPNVYAMVSYLENFKTNRQVKSHATLGGLLDNVLEKVVKSDGAITIRDTAQYFDTWSNNLSKTTDNWREGVTRRFKHILFSTDEIEGGLFDLAQTRENIFPFSAQIDFETDASVEFAQILKDSKLDKKFLESMVDDFITADNVVPRKMTISYNEDQATTLQENVTLNSWDITKWWERLEEEITTERVGVRGIDNQTTFFVEPEREEKGYTVIDAFIDEESSSSSLYSQLLRIVFLGKMRSFIAKHSRSYCDILSGKPAHSEPVVYKITKHEVNKKGNIKRAPKQSFYFSNSNDIEEISFVDTQVKFGERYVYKLWSYRVVVGNSYTYKDLDGKDFIEPQDNNVATVKVENSTKLYLFETEEKIFDPILITDDPPAPPEVEFIPFLGDDKRISISLNTAVSETIQEPVGIYEEDDRIFSSYNAQQKLEGGKVRFAGDDINKSYEVFRTTFHPRQYTDFADFKIAEVSAELVTTKGRYTPEVTFIDNVMPNTKYYYTFRARDKHNKISNPTNIFEVELVNSSGAIYPVIQVVELNSEKKNYKVKNAKKYVKITVADLQKAFNLSKSRLSTRRKFNARLDEIFLGDTERSVWDKKIKLRITSKTTGRKVDVNFRVNYDAKFVDASGVLTNDTVLENPQSISDIINTVDQEN